MTRLETWNFVRRQCNHFTAEERTLIAQRFREGAKAYDVARELKCSVRVIHTHYARMRGGAANPVRGMQKFEQPKPREIDKSSRFYHSNFEPS